MRQSYTEWHLVVIDDGSTEPKLLEAIEKHRSDQRITVLRNEKNMGIAISLNIGIEHASKLGVKYIARMDSDDISLRDRLLAQVNFMESKSVVDVCGTNMIILRQNAEPRIVSMPTLGSLIRYNLTFYCTLGHPTIMFRASKAHLFVYNESLMEDYDLWLRIGKKVQFANIGQALICLRKHMEN